MNFYIKKTNMNLKYFKKVINNYLLIFNIKICNIFTMNDTINVSLNNENQNEKCKIKKYKIKKYPKNLLKPMKYLLQKNNETSSNNETSFLNKKRNRKKNNKPKLGYYEDLKDKDNIDYGHAWKYLKVTDNNNNDIFCKVIKIDNNNNELIQNLENAIEIHHSLNKKKNIVKLLYAYKKEYDYKSFYFIFTKYQKNGDLLNYINKKFQENTIDKDELFEFAYQIINIIKFLHKKNISHRDIKLENFILDDDKNLILIDFEFSTIEETDNTPCGTPFYADPNMLICKKNDTKYNCKASDMYSLGITLNSLFYGNFKFNILNEPIVYIGNTIKNNLDICISNLIRINVTDRYKIDDVLKSTFYSNIQLLHNIKD